MNLRIHIFIACLFTFLNISVFQAGANNAQFHNLNEEYGVSFRETNSICSDLNGFIWISSKMGIVRYSQDDIRTYELPYETADIITVRLTFYHGVLYAFTNNGQIFKYDAIKDRFLLAVNLSKTLRNPYLLVSGLLVDTEGRLWVSSTSGLFCYDDSNGLKSLEPSGYIHVMMWYDNEKFILAVDGELRLFNPDDYSSEVFYRFPEGEINTVSYIYHDVAQNALWIGTMENGLYVLKNGTSKSLVKLHDIPSQPVLAIVNSADSTLLIGVDGQGIWEVNKNSLQVLSVMKEDSDNPASLKGNGVYDICIDNNKRVWICTYSGGVSYFDQASSIVEKVNHVVNNPNSLINDDVNSVLEDRNGNIWFATNNGVSKWERKLNRWTPFFHNKKEHAQVFLSLCEDERGRIWAGSYSSGVYVLDENTGRILNHYSQEETDGKFRSNFIFDLYKDRKGDIWIGGVRGDLICYRHDTGQFVSYPNMTVNVILEYNDDKLLIGTTYGLLLFDKNTGGTETLIDGYLTSDLILKDNVVWICTSGDGLVRYDLSTKDKKRYTVDSGLPSNFVNSIEFSKGYFWIGTEQGICRLDQSDNTILTFNSLLELNSVSFNDNSHFKLRNGNLIWGTNHGALIFNPDAIQPQKHEGQIFFQDLTVAGRSIRESSDISLTAPLDSLQELSLKYFQNTVSLEMIPIRVTVPGVKFSWKMEKLDNEWSKPGNNRILSYSNIPSGDYTLRIRMLESSLTNIMAERSVNLRIIPPFWETLWFRIIAFSFLLGLAIFLFAFYIDRLKKQHSEEKIRFFANTAHDIRTSLTLIKGPVEELNKEPGLTNKGLQYLHLATEQTQRLSKVVTQLMDFQKVDIGKERLSLVMVDIVKLIKNRVMMFESYAKTKNIDLKFNSNFQSFVTAVDEVMVEKVIDNLISNAIKYSFTDVPVNVNFQVSSNKWYLEVQDQGIGISKKAQRQLFNEYYRGDNAVNSKIVGSGIGLLLVKNYVALHGGKVSCYSQQNVGSSFHVSMPIKTTSEDTLTERQIKDKPQEKPSSVKAPASTIMLSEVKSPVKNKMRILIVEDHEYLREFLKSALEEEFQVDLAEDGQQAWEMIQKVTPDLVVSDIMMPRMDGYELCEKLKSTYETSHIPIILLTSLSGKTQHLKGLGLGADDYLTKPFDVTLVQQRIKTIIQNRELIREKALKIIKHIEENEAILDNELNDKFLKKMGEVVRENMANSEFSKDDFAAAMNVSPSLLYKKIKSLTDQSPTDFIKTIRLDHSLDLLQSKKYTITEISELCGFSSVGYFSTVFRKHYGKSPTQIG